MEGNQSLLARNIYQANANNYDQIFEQEVSQFFEWSASLRTSSLEYSQSDLEKTTTGNMFFRPLDYQQPLEEYPDGDWRAYWLFPVYTDHQKHSLFMFTEESTKRYPNDHEYDKEFILSQTATEQYYGRSASKGKLNTTPSLSQKSEDDGIQVFGSPPTYLHLIETLLRLPLSTVACGLTQQSNNETPRPAAPWPPKPSFSATSWSANPYAKPWSPIPSSSATSWSPKPSSSAKSWSPNPYANPWSPKPSYSASSLSPKPSSSATSWSSKPSSCAMSWSPKPSSSAKSWSPNPHAKPWSPNPSSSAESWSPDPNSSALSDDLQFLLNINPELDDVQTLSFVSSDPQQTSF